MAVGHLHTQDTSEHHAHLSLSRTRSAVSAVLRRKSTTKHDDSDDVNDDSSTDWSQFPDYKALNNDEATRRERKLGLTWTDLTIRGVAAEACIEENTLSQFVPGRLKGSIKASEKSLKTIVESTSGFVGPGEMLLVLGRPGAGCTSLLKVLGNQRKGFEEIDGLVNYGSLDHKEAEVYRGQIIFNSERETFYPVLTVRQTIDFATRLKTPNHKMPGFHTSEEARVASRDFFLKLLGIEHTLETKVGDEYVRGVSGGERKRVSIVEAMTTRGSIYCWDNPTRGLDASTALQYIQAIRALTDLFGLSSVITIYQAGNSIYDLFDKTLVLDHGKEIYYGPAAKAKSFMEDLGFVCADGANVADFLTGVTVPTERQIRDGYCESFPRSVDAIREVYLASHIRSEMNAQLQYPGTEAAKINTEIFKNTINNEKESGLMADRSSATVGFGRQLQAAVLRQYALQRGDWKTVAVKQGSNLIQAFTSGSLFYNAPSNSAGLFLKSGVLFVSLLFNALLAQGEVTDSFSGRPILSRHKTFAFHHPAILNLAQIIIDLPIQIFQVSVFSLVVYFLAGLKVSASAFFLFWFIILSATICLTALFRAIGAAFPTFDAASKVSGLLVSSLLLYNGYMISKREMHPWFVWIYWIDPLAYAYNALLSNEFFQQTIPCVGPNLVPSGPGYNSPQNQACTGVQGATLGANNVTGEQYLKSLSYGRSDLARNITIVWAWWAFYVVLTMVFTHFWEDVASQSQLLLVPRDVIKAPKRTAVKDVEAQSSGEKSNITSGNSSTQAPQSDEESQLTRNTSVFTWKNLSYTIETSSGPRVLLNNVNGWVKPGMLGALMGSSGAGKTTLLDVLAQRKTDGTIKGSVLVDGRPLNISFQRSAGYCEQQDVHEPLSTVREALEFSALLRQSRSISREEKLRYVDTIVDLLEMHDIENCLIGSSSGSGLSVEARKRLTIGIELVSKPSILIFLDEPTSGLDGQSAFNIVRFLKKLSNAGQAILVTIHQPSALLFYQFDTLLLLAKGGRTIYFGDIGDNAETVKGYFARNNAPCPPEANPAEHIIDVVDSHGKEWNRKWLESTEYKLMTVELDKMIQQAANSPEGTNVDNHEFAMPLWDQCLIVSKRMSMSIYRNVEYTNNKFALHVILGLFVGFSFWMVGDSVGDLKLRLFAVFNLIFVAPGVIAQLQPLFLEKRDIYEIREKKAKMYSWVAFVTAMIVAEIPYLIVCAVLYLACFYFTVGFPSQADRAGPIFLIMLLYEFVYTGIGQFIAAYASNAVAATLINPLVIFTLVGFCGVIVPYSQLQNFWKYWLYYINPFKYLTGSLLVFSLHDIQIQCKEEEFAVFDPVINQTCGTYLESYLRGMGNGANLVNPNATSGCKVCQYTTGQDYLKTVNLPELYYGWRDLGIVALYVFSGYACVYLLMKLRTKKTKKAEGN